MTEQELKMNAKFAKNTIDVVSLAKVYAKAYADAQVSAKDTEIAELKARLENKECARSLAMSGLVDMEIKNKSLKAEIKRLREENESFKRSEYCIRIDAVKSVYSRNSLQEEDDCELLSPADAGTEDVDTISKFAPKKTIKVKAKITKISTFSPKNENQNV